MRLWFTRLMRPELEQSYHSSKIIYITTTAMLLSSFIEQFIKKQISFPTFRGCSCLGEARDATERW